MVRAVRIGYGDRRRTLRCLTHTCPSPRVSQSPSRPQSSVTFTANSTIC